MQQDGVRPFQLPSMGTVAATLINPKCKEAVMKYLLTSALVSMLATVLFSDPENIHGALSNAQAAIAMLSQIFKG